MGKFKDENAGEIMEEFIGLKPKMYSSINYQDTSSHIKAKGINKAASKLLKHQEFLDCYNNSEIKMCKMNTLRSYNHQIFAVSINKTGLSPYDDKSYYLDRDTALRYGHNKIPKSNCKSVWIR